MHWKVKPPIQVGTALVLSPSRSTKFFARPSSSMVQPQELVLTRVHLVPSVNLVSWAEVATKPLLAMAVPAKSEVMGRATLSAITVAEPLAPLWSLAMRMVTVLSVGAAVMPEAKAKMVEARMVVNCILKVVGWLCG